jgi:transcription elongation factor/antiterminator RfaH
LNLFEAPLQIQGARLPWFALQVRTRRERLVSTHLKGQGYECLLPLYKSQRQWSDRVKELERPLFPGYLFCRFDFQNRRPLVVTPGVIRIVGMGDRPMPIEDQEIEAIQLAQASGLQSQPWPYLEVGERVRVNYGNLSGLEGILVNLKGNHRVVLSVRLLQRSVAMEVDLAWLAPVRGLPNPHQESSKGFVRPVVTAPVAG